MVYFAKRCFLFSNCDLKEEVEKQLFKYRARAPQLMSCIERTIIESYVAPFSETITFEYIDFFAIKSIKT